MAEPEPSSSPAAEAPIPDEDDHDGEMPLTMAASVILTSLPKDAHAALDRAGELPQAKVTVRFKAVGSAPLLKQSVFKISSTQRFETVVNFLRKKLGVPRSESMFCYVNSVFAPSLDENVGNLWRCFKTADELVVAYAKMPAFG